MTENNNSGNRRTSISVGIALLLLSLSLGVHAQKPNDPQYIGWVSEISGEWFLTAPGEAPKKIGLGQRLVAGGTVRPKMSGSGYSIKIGFLNPKRKPEIRSCGKPGECNQPIELPKSLEINSSLAGRLLQAAEKFLTSSGTYVSTISRSADRSGDLQDAVVKMTLGEIDLTPVFASMKPGQYLLLLQPIRLDNRSGEGVRIISVPFDWQPNRSFLVSIDGTKSGLYKLSLLNPRTKEPTGSEAWILMRQREEYDEAATSFGEAMALTAQWDKALLSSDKVRGLRRAYLESLLQPNQ